MINNKKKIYYLKLFQVGIFCIDKILKQHKFLMNKICMKNYPSYQHMSLQDKVNKYQHRYLNKFLQGKLYMLLRLMMNKIQMDN